MANHYDFVMPYYTVYLEGMIGQSDTLHNSVSR